jgi:hypothetical protein
MDGSQILDTQSYLYYSYICLSINSYLQHNGYAHNGQKEMVSWNSFKYVELFWFTRIELIKHLLEKMK